MTDNIKESKSQANKRIAKNTLILYVRMIFLMLVSLYTSRVVLNALGVEDFGIYNVVGGLVAMFSIISASLSSAISRFITFELGKGDLEKLKMIFSASVTIQVIISLIIIVLIELVGVWFLNTHMVIPQERMLAANWVLQLSVITFVINLISVPYNAAIIAHEKMSAFAYISILEALGRLSVALAIVHSPIDRLIFYAALITGVAVLVRIVYGLYCNKHFTECHCHFCWDSDLLKQMFSFAGWNFIGSSSAILRDQGGNILLNLFSGPVVNAARGISLQVNHAIIGFSENFMMALKPQIIKSYAQGDRSYMMTLVFQGARLSFYMLLLLSVPIFMNTEYILTLWLKQFPDHTINFVQLVLIFTLCESISVPLVTSMQATGKIRNYQIVVGGLQMMNIPVSYVLLLLGNPPECVLWAAIAISQCCLAARLYMLHIQIKLPVKSYLKKVYLNVIIVSAISIVLSWLCLHNINEGILGFILSCIVCLLLTFATIFFVGCNNNERKMVVCKSRNIIRNRFTDNDRDKE